MVQQNCQEETSFFREPTLLRGQTVRSEDFSGELQCEPGESQQAEPTDDAEARADFWSIQGDDRQWTSSSALCAEGRNIPHSTAIHWWNKVYSHWSGRHARETYWWLLERRFEQKLVRFVERFSRSSHYWQKNLPRDICGPGGDWQKFKRLLDQITCVQK